jgi:hypothetical protein
MGAGTGPVMPEQTADDTDVGWGDDREEDRRGGAESDDERLLADVPPHHVDRDR